MEAEDPAEFIELGRTDWYDTGGRCLHYVTPETWTAGQRGEMAEAWAVVTPVRLACGRPAAVAVIPGLFTRMSAPRCKGCCRATGMPEGKGSPKNDGACRALLGLP